MMKDIRHSQYKTLQYTYNSCTNTVLSCLINEELDCSYGIDFNVL